MHKRKQRKDLDSDTNVCAFCCEPSDEKKCGKFFTSQLGFSVHQYCMFFSAALPQNGQDDEGFEGFLEQDVLKEIRRAGRLRCCLCLKKGASAGCCDQNCKRGFHFTCGVKEKYLFQFYGQFRAFCFEHRLHQNSTSYPSKKAPCPICLESVPCSASPDVLTTPCCKDVWLHRSCVQEQAIVSGYFFRCAVCNNKEKFVQEMKRMGVYVPDRDAAWEEGNNFAELLEKYSHCDNSPCSCPMGRQFTADSGQWELVLCSSCGQYGTHVGCKIWSTNPPSMLCPTCRPVHEPSVPAAEPLAPSPVESVTTSPVNRKGRGRSRGQRSHTESSDTDSDDISAVLNGLKRHTEDDFLNSDTNFFVQRAIAAGTAVIEHSGPKKSKTSQSASTNCNRKRKAEDAFRNASEGNDDEILITKYVPGKKCEMCPKCNRRKPMIIPTSSPAKKPRKVSPAGGSSAVGRWNTGSTCTITKANMKSKEAGYESAGFETSRGKGDAVAAGVKVADYEVLELAAQRTDKSSVLLLSSEETPSEFEDKSQQEDTDVTENVKGPQIDAPGKAANSSWKRFLGDEFVQCLNPRSSREPIDENNNLRKDVLETSEIARQPSDVRRSLAEGSREVSESSRESESIRKPSEHSRCLSERTRKVSESNNEMDKKVSSVTSRKSGSPRKRSSVIDRSSDSNKKEKSEGEVDVTLREATGGKSPSTKKKSETTGERSLGKASTTAEANLTQPESNTNPSKFSNSLADPSDENLCSRSDNSNKKVQFLTKKAVLEAVIEHTMELKNSGKELPHRCVSSC